MARDGAVRNAVREDNKLRLEDHAVHDWYRAVMEEKDLSDLVREAVDHLLAKKPR